MATCLYCRSECKYTGFSTSEGCTNSVCKAYVKSDLMKRYAETKVNPNFYREIPIKAEAYHTIEPLKLKYGATLGMDESGWPSYKEFDNTILGKQKRIVHRMCSDELLSKWEKTGCLEDLSDSNQRKMARILENQITHWVNDRNAYEREGEDKERFELLQTLMLPIIYRTYKQLMEDNFVDIQPILFPCDLTYFWNSESKFCSHAVTANTRKLKTCAPRSDMIEDVHAIQRIDAEAEVVQMISDQLYLDIKMEILRDLTFSRGKEISKTYTADLDSLTCTIDYFMRRYDFMVTSPDIHELIKDVDFEDLEIYNEPFYFQNMMLFGKRSKSFAKGYAYCPYVPIIKSPIIYKGSHHILMTRYGKKMFDPTQYDVVKFKGLPLL